MHSSPALATSSAVSDDLALLPGSLQEMAGVIGFDGVLTLVREYGGVRLYVPRTLPADHILITLLGTEAAQRLAVEYGGREHFDIPRAEQLLRTIRNRRIRADRAQGASRRDLALKYRLTERAIDNILGPEPADDGQVDLFGGEE